MTRLLLAIVVVTCVRLAVAGTTGIVEDEAYYWVWSERLAAGYYDHPPGIAWLIAPFAHVFGATALGVRAGPVLATAGGMAILLPFAMDRWLFLALFAAMPLFGLGGLLATPDAPLLLGWSIAIAGAIRAQRDPRAWILAGVGAGLAGLGKYTGWGLWPLLLLGAGLPRRGSVRWILGGLLTTLALVSPNLWWNAAHGWTSVQFQLGHGLSTPGGEGAPGAWGALGYLATQAGLVTPVVFGAFIVFGLYYPRDRVDRIAWWTSVPVLLFFTLAAMVAPAEANWAAPAWVGAALGLARAGPRVRRAGWVGAGFAGIVTALALVHVFRPLIALSNDPVARLGAGAQLAESVQAWGVEPVYTERYQEAALIRYYEGLVTHALPEVGRPDQYDLWPVPWADHALVVRPWRGGDGMPTDRYCAERGGRVSVTERDAAGVVGRWQVAEVHGCGPAAAVE